jgi:hypothetical protein
MAVNEFHEGTSRVVGAHSHPLSVAVAKYRRPCIRPEGPQRLERQFTYDFPSRTHYEKRSHRSFWDEIRGVFELLNTKSLNEKQRWRLSLKNPWISPTRLRGTWLKSSAGGQPLRKMGLQNKRKGRCPEDVPGTRNERLFHEGGIRSETMWFLQTNIAPQSCAAPSPGGEYANDSSPSQSI